MRVNFAFACLESDAGNVQAAIRLRRALPEEVPVVACATGSAGSSLITLLDRSASGYLGNVHAFGLLDEICRPEVVLNLESESIARAVHLDYVRRRVASEPGQRPGTRRVGGPPRRPARVEPAAGRGHPRQARRDRIRVRAHQRLGRRPGRAHRRAGRGTRAPRARPMARRAAAGRLALRPGPRRARQTVALPGALGRADRGCAQSGPGRRPADPHCPRQGGIRSHPAPRTSRAAASHPGNGRPQACYTRATV